MPSLDKTPRRKKMEDTAAPAASPQTADSPRPAILYSRVTMVWQGNPDNSRVLLVFVNKVSTLQIEKLPWDLTSPLLHFLHLSNHLRKWFSLKL